MLILAQKLRNVLIDLQFWLIELDVLIFSGIKYDFLKNKQMIKVFFILGVRQSGFE